MHEIGLGHNRGNYLRGKKRLYRPLDPATTSILEIPKEELKRRRLSEALTLVMYADRRRNWRLTKKLALGPLAVKVRDHHQRTNVWGQKRCLIGTADDFTTAAPDDDLSNHLYTADDPELRACGMADYLAPDGEEEEEQTKDEEIAEKSLADNTSIVAPGAVYSTASNVHRRNLQKE